MGAKILSMAVLTLSFSAALASSGLASGPVLSQSELEGIAKEWVSDLIDLDPMFANDCAQLFQTQATSIGSLYKDGDGLSEKSPVSAIELEFIAVSWFAFEGAARQNIQAHPIWVEARKSSPNTEKAASQISMFSCDEKSESPDGRISKFDQFMCESDPKAKQSILVSIQESCAAVARAMFSEETLPIGTSGYPDSFYVKASK